MIRRPFVGDFYFEWQLGPVVLQWARPEYRATFNVRRFRAWLDPYWRRTC